VCAAGAQWLASDEFHQSGWVACFMDGAPLWERSLDGPVLTMRALDAQSVDLFTGNALSTVQLADGSVGNRRAVNVPFADRGALTFGDNVLVFDQKSAQIIAQNGTSIWAQDNLPGNLIGIAPSGAIYLAAYEGLNTKLDRLESAVTWEVPAVSDSPLAAATFDISDRDATKSCQALCAKAMPARCGNLLGSPFTSTPECVTACIHPARCATELGAVAECVASRGSISCDGSGAAFSGCDEQSKALTLCGMNGQAKP
jgi:hypothetical protein